MVIAISWVKPTDHKSVCDPSIILLIWREEMIPETTIGDSAREHANHSHKDLVHFTHWKGQKDERNKCSGWILGWVLDKGLWNWNIFHQRNGIKCPESVESATVHVGKKNKGIIFTLKWCQKEQRHHFSTEMMSEGKGCNVNSQHAVERYFQAHNVYFLQNKENFIPSVRSKYFSTIYNASPTCEAGLFVRNNRIGSRLWQRRHRRTAHKFVETVACREQGENLCRNCRLF